MKTLRVTIAVLAAMAAGVARYSGAQANPVAAPVAAAHQGLVVPAGEQIPLMVMRPVWAKTAKVGDPVFAQAAFPVSVANTMAVPAGTYVQGSLLAIVKPTKKVAKSLLRMEFTKMVFANGYTVTLPADSAVMDVTMQASTENDLLLDNGAQVEMTLAEPVKLSGKQVRAAIALSRAPKAGASATLCRTIPGTPGSPGTPGTPDTVIPGTPSQTIPSGIDGVPDTVIPGTPDTVIPGTPATPADPGSPPIYCPAAPFMVSSVVASGPAPQPVVQEKAKKAKK